jgi:hypothetical protein
MLNPRRPRWLGTERHTASEPLRSLGSGKLHAPRTPDARSARHLATVCILHDGAPAAFGDKALGRVGLRLVVAPPLATAAVLAVPR